MDSRKHSHKYTKGCEDIERTLAALEDIRKRQARAKWIRDNFGKYRGEVQTDRQVRLNIDIVGKNKDKGDEE